MAVYLYNGVPMKELPYWDKTKYPYAFLANATLFEFDHYLLRVMDRPGYIYQSDDRYILGSNAPPVMGDWIIPKAEATTTGEWTVYQAIGQIDVESQLPNVFWTNQSGGIKDQSGNLWLAPSEPLLAEPTTPDAEPIAYLYGGVKLPQIPDEIAAHSYIVIIQFNDRYTVIGSEEVAYVTHDVVENETAYKITIPSAAIGATYVPSSDVTWRDVVAINTDMETRLDESIILIYNNHDVENFTDDTIHATQSLAPVPIYDDSPDTPQVTVQFDINSWLKGFVVGMSGKPLPFISISGDDNSGDDTDIDPVPSI